MTATTKRHPQEDDTFAATQETVKRLAGPAFADHVLTELGPQEWRCATPGTGDYAFTVIVRPSMVLIYGDLGEAVFRGGGAEDTLGWLRRAVYSPDYLREKQSNAQDFFYPGDVIRWARLSAGEGSVLGDKLLCRIEADPGHFGGGGIDEWSWPQMVAEAGGDGEVMGFGQNACPRALWLCEALRWLVEHLPAAEATR